MPSEPSVLRERNAALEAEVRLLRQMLDDMKGERSDLNAEMDHHLAREETCNPPRIINEGLRSA
jgi:predicted nuclease with TOPRIM domain